jgi:hypothetical protein
MAVVSFPVAELLATTSAPEVRDLGYLVSVAVARTTKARERSVRATDDRSERVYAIAGELAALEHACRERAETGWWAWGVESYAIRPGGALSGGALWSLAVVGVVLGAAAARREWAVAVTAAERARAVAGRASATKDEVIEAAGGAEALRAAARTKLPGGCLEHAADAVAVAWATAARIRDVYGAVLRRQGV